MNQISYLTRKKKIGISLELLKKILKVILLIFEILRNLKNL